MPNSVAEAYLLILRPSMVPVVGEAVPEPFNEQIEIDEWSWTLENEEYAERTAARDKARDFARNKSADRDKTVAFAFDGKDARDLATDLMAAQTQKDLSPAARQKKVRGLLDQMTIAVEKDDRIKAENEKQEKRDKGEDDDQDKLKFTFRKNLDASTTQLLNSMKSGHRMPRAILTLFHRSSNAPVTLAIKFEGVRLKSYSLSVEPDETMADLVEEWEATYESVEYSYQNRPAASGPNGVTKGTVRVFKKKGGSFI